VIQGRKVHLWARILLTGCLILGAACGPKVPDETAALVNGQPITMEALAWAARGFGAGEQSAETKPARLKKRLLDQLIDEELIVQEGRRRGFAVSDAELERMIEAFKADYPGQAFEEMMIREYVNPELWKDQMRRNILVKKTTEAELKSRVKVDTEEWEHFFQAHRNADRPPVRMRVIHLTAQTREQAQRLLERVRRGRSFERMARELFGPDEDGRSEEGVWVYPAALPDSIAKALESTPVGQVTGIVEGDFGFAFFKILAKEDQPRPGPGEIMRQLKDRYLAQIEARAYEAWVRELRAKADIVIDPTLSTDLEEEQTR